MRYERYAKWGKLDLSVKLRDYGSNRENAKPLKHLQRLCQLLPRTISRGLKIPYRCLLIPKSEAAGGLKLVETCANFPATLANCDFASSIGVSHKSESGTKLKISTSRSGTGEDSGLGLKLDRRIWRSQALQSNSAMSQKSDIPEGLRSKLKTPMWQSEHCQRDRLSYRSDLRLSHLNENTVQFPIAQCTVSEYRYIYTAIYGSLM